MAEIKDTIDEVLDKAGETSDRLNNVIALLVVFLATVMALFNVKGGNIGQAMAQAQARSVNAWAFFQAKSTKKILSETMLEQLILERERDGSLTQEGAALIDKKIAFYREAVNRYEKEKEEIKQQAEGYEQEYDRLNYHDDQFDIAEAGITVALAILGIAALTRRKWLIWCALVFAGVGVASGTAGFVGVSFHLDFLANLLG